MAEAIVTPHDAFNDLRTKLASEPHRTAGLTAVYQFDISGEHGGKWYVDIADGRAEVRDGSAADPNCTIAMTDEDYVAMATQKLSGQMAFMTGKLRVSGDTGLAMRAATIFG